MILKKLDFLSPQITLYHKGFLSHSSTTSGIISIISFIIIIVFAVYYSLDLIKRQNPKAYFFNRFIKDSGLFPLNSSSIYHYISMNAYHVIKEFDFYSFRLVGLEQNYVEYLEDRNLSKFDHWLYGFCNYEIDGLEMKYLLNKENFENSACIKKFYNSLDKTYYDIGNPKFKWPIIRHGNVNTDSNGYSVVIEKCKNDTLELILGKGNKCTDLSKLNYLFTGKWGTHFNFIDHYVDVLDCKDPNRKYFYTVENALDKDNYSINHINLNPSSITSNIGLIFDKIKEELSYIFDRNDVFTEKGKKDDVYMIYNLWMKNRMQYYVRKYKTIQDVISDIGGISEFITLLASFINSFYNNYKTLSDFEKIISPSIANRMNKSKNLINNNTTKKRNKNINHSETNKTNKTDDNTEIGKNVNSNNELRKKHKNQKHDSNINNFAYINEKGYKNDSQILNDKIGDNTDNLENKQNNTINFTNFMINKITCNKKNKYFKIYEKFRIQILSEEYLLKNYLDIYSLLKMCEVNSFELEKKYILKDLINKG